MSNKGLAIKTTVGELQWINISGKGREFVNKSGKGDGNFKYSATIMLGKSEGKELADTLENAYKESSLYDEAGRRPFYEVRKKHTEQNEKGNALHNKEDLGKLVFKFSTRTTWPDGNAKVIEVYNSKGKEITEAFADKKIANGSTGCVSGSFGIYDDGCTLYLDAVQIAKFIEYKQGADFDDIGEGYTGEEDQKFESIEEPAEKLEL